MKSKSVFNNAKWIIICKIVQSIMQLIIGMISARYLGPSNYGLINYAASIVAFAMPIMQLGLRSTLVQEFVQAPEKEGEIIGTSLLMNTVSAIASIVGVFGFVCFADAGETETILVCLLYSFSIFFAALEMIQYWFQYKLYSKYSSVIMLCAYVLVSAYKIFLLATQKSVYWFAVTHSIEYGMIGIAMIVAYKKLHGSRLSISWSRAKQMLYRSRHYILSAMMVVIIQNTDHIMITNMLGKADNGFYSAAITCAGVAQFVYAAIIDSFRPLILTSKKENKFEYEKNVSCLYGIVIYMAVAQGIVFTLLAKWIVGLMYGSAYAPSVQILQILVWYIAFSQIGTIRNVWILAEEKHKYLPLINFIGAASNVALNFCLIPVLGAFGAALASFLTQMTTNFILGFIIRPIRYNNKLLLRGVVPGFIFRELKNIVSDIRKK